MVRWVNFLAMLAFGVALLLVGGWFAMLRVAYSAPQAPNPMQLSHSFHASVRWLVDHESEIMSDGNSMLWRMLREASVVSGDPELQRLSQRYRTQWVEQGTANYWGKLFDPAVGKSMFIGDSELSSMAGYQRLFAFTLSCQADIGARSDVQRELSFELCSPHLAKAAYTDPHCVTHQLMGLMLMKQARCIPQRQVDHLVEVSQERLELELRYDFRVSDAYVQRVLMLYRTGAGAKVQAAWLSSVLAAQRQDGGWTYSYALPGLSWGGQPVYWHGLRHGGLSVQAQQGNFHTTVQGALLMALAMADSPVAALQAVAWEP